MNRTLSYAQEDILAVFRALDRPTIDSISRRVAYPEASVRRDIQALRRAGHNIVCNHDGDQYGGPTYTLVVTPAPELVGADQ
jgi:hypothetical protein